MSGSKYSVLTAATAPSYPLRHKSQARSLLSATWPISCLAYGRIAVSAFEWLLQKQVQRRLCLFAPQTPVCRYGYPTLTHLRPQRKAVMVIQGDILLIGMLSQPRQDLLPFVTAGEPGRRVHNGRSVPGEAAIQVSDKRPG